jgi:hypothetical protein
MRVSNNLEIRVHGLQRSGNHAILHWIACQCPDVVLLLNDVAPGLNPFDSMAEYVEYRGGSVFKSANLWEPEPDFIAANVPRERDTIIYSYEDRRLTPSNRKQAGAWLGASRRFIDLLIIRDPLNFFASRLASWGKLNGIQDKSALLELWKRYATEALFPATLSKSSTITANFSLWSASRAYRRLLAQSLGLKFSDRGFNQMVRLGLGSSFEGFMYSSRASRMRVNDRWKNYVEDETFLSILSDAGLQRLGDDLFSSMPGWRVMRKVFRDPINFPPVSLENLVERPQLSSIGSG